MRYLCIAAMLGVSALAGLWATAEKVRGDAVVYYYPAPGVVYHSSYRPVYYSQPVYYAPPTYYSCYSPCVCYTRPDSCQESDSDQRSGARGDSPKEPTPVPPTTTTTLGANDNRFSPQSINILPEHHA